MPDETTLSGICPSEAKAAAAVGGWQKIERDWCAFDWAKNQVLNNLDNAGFDKTLRIPNGTLYTTTPLNLTCINDASSSDGCTASSHGNFYVDFRGSKVICATGSSCIDGLGSRYVIMISPNIYGVTGAKEPKIGIQIGHTNRMYGADNWTIFDPTTEGYFSVTPFYNFASESLRVFGGTFHNNDRSLTGPCSSTVNAHEACAAMFDAGNHYGITSLFVTESISTDTVQTFAGNYFDGTRFYPGTASSGLWIYGTWGLHISRGYVTTSDYCVNIYSDGQPKLSTKLMICNLISIANMSHRGPFCPICRLLRLLLCMCLFMA